MKHKVLAIFTVLTLAIAALGVALAGTLTLVINGTSISIDGFVEQNTAWVSLLPFMQALGEGTRPVKIDLPSSTMVLTKGDGSKQVSVPIQTKNRSVYVDAVAAARGLGYSVSLDASTLTINSSTASTPSNTPTAQVAMYPKNMDAALIDDAVRSLYNALDSGNADAALEAVLNGSGITVFGSQEHPADTDLLNVYELMHRSFALSLEIFTLQMGYKYRFFTKLDDLLAGLKERKIATLDRARLQSGIDNAFALEKPSRSQVITALVAAMGRERVRRGISLSFKRDPFWGDDALDPIQLRLLDTVLTNGFALGAPGINTLLATRAFTNQVRSTRPKNAALESRRSSSQLISKADISVPEPIQKLFNWAAEKAVDTIATETYPGVKDTMDHEIADLAGVPLPTPFDKNMYKALLEGDIGKVKTSFGNLRAGLIKEALKEGAQVILCGSMILYGYQASLEFEHSEVHHRTDGDAEGPYSSKIKLKVEFTDDYHKNVFDKKVFTVAGISVTPPPVENGALFTKLGCDFPKVGAAKDKPVQWELTSELIPHTETGQLIVFPNSLKTNAAGESEARFEAIKENVPKAFRLGKYTASVNGGITVTIQNLLPTNWWRIQAAAQVGQTEDKAGTNFKRLIVHYFEFPKLKLEFDSNLHIVGQSEYGLMHYNAELVSSVPLAVKPEGDDLQKKFIVYQGSNSLHYEQYHLDTATGCRINNVQSGMLDVLVGARSFESDEVSVGLNDLLKRPSETVACPEGARGGNIWSGGFLTLHNDVLGKFQLPNVDSPVPNYIFRSPKEAVATQVLWQKTVQRDYTQPNIAINENTSIKLQVQP